MTTSNKGWVSIFAAAGLLLGAGLAQAGVVGSKHDFTAGGSAQRTTTDAVTTEVCVFCHTPHGSATTAPVPLWNKRLPDGGSYTRYSSLNLPSFTSAEAPVGSVSLACLSCHDGTQAMDVVLNSPGSGGYDPSGNTVIDPTIGVMQPESPGAPIPVLGTDLSNDHPVSMQYGGGGLISGDPDGPAPDNLGDPDFVLPQKATINGSAIWWVDSAVGVGGTREKTDMLLYARSDLQGGGPTDPTEPFVECGSCHDPHNDESALTASTVQFLRISNNDSRICTACHVK